MERDGFLKCVVKLAVKTRFSTNLNNSKSSVIPDNTIGLYDYLPKRKRKFLQVNAVQLFV